MRIVLLTGLICFFGGCLTTNLNPEAISSPIISLSRSNTRPLNISVESRLTSPKTGNQYLFLLIPFGRIQAPRISEQVANELFTRLTLKGFNPQFVAPGSHTRDNAPILNLFIDELTLSAYDLLFLRRMAGEMKLSGQLKSNDGSTQRMESARGHESRTAPFAFEGELSNLLRVITEQSVKDLLEKIGI